MAFYGKDLREVLNDVMNEFGYFYYDRIDIHLTDDESKRIRAKLGSFKPASVAGEKITDMKTLDGVKLYVPDKSWILVQAVRDRAPAQDLLRSDLKR